MDNIELTVLRYLLYEPTAIRAFISAKISTGFFYNDVHKTIYKVMGTYYRAYGQGISIPVLTQELTKFYAPEYFGEILAFDSADMADISEKWLLDSFIDYKKTRIVKSGIEELIKKSDAHSIKEAESQLARMHSDLTKLGITNEQIFDLDSDISSHIQSLSIPRQGATILTGFKQLDTIVRGLKPGWLVTLVARPKVGKTRTLINAAVNMVRRKVNVLFFSVEVEKDQCANLLLSCLGEVLYSKVEDHAVTPEDLHKFNIEVEKINAGDYGKLTVIDTCGIPTPEYIKLKLEETETSLGVKYDVVIVDYAGMMAPDVSTGKDNMDQSQIAEALKNLAREKRKVVMTAVQHKPQENNSKKIPDKLTGDGAISRSDRWLQISDLILIIQNIEEESSDKNMYGTLKFKVIARFTQPFRFELLKDFAVTKLHSSDGNNFSSHSSTSPDTRI